MNFLSMLGGVFNTKLSGDFSWLQGIVDFLDSLLVPVTIIVAVAGAIWVIFLGVNLARAESADKAQEAKKRLINVAVAIVCVIVFIWLLTWFASSVEVIFKKAPISSATSAA